MHDLIIERIHPDAILPTYATDDDSGMDLYAVEDMILKPGEKGLCPLGFKMAIPRHEFHDAGYRWEAQIRPRSGTSAKSTLQIPNSPATIDNGYRGELKVIVFNAALPEYELDVESGYLSGPDEGPYGVERVVLTQPNTGYIYDLKGETQTIRGEYDHPRNSLIIQKGDRFAQLVFVEVKRPRRIIEGVVSDDTERGSGGFGHTGK